MIEVDPAPFNKGDVVFLNSGGPPMTVSHVFKTNDESDWYVEATWYDNKCRIVEAEFHPLQLTKEEPTI